MCTLQHQCKRAASPDSDSDEENQPPTEDQPIKKTCRSLAKANSSSSSDFTSLKEMLQESERRQEAVNKEMVCYEHGLSTAKDVLNYGPTRTHKSHGRM